MSNYTDLFGQSFGKPKRVTVLTTGAGNFVPLLAMGRYTATMQGAGAGGRTSGSSAGPGGAAGAWVRFSGTFLTTAAIPYVVGAPGVAGTTSTPGGNTTLGSVVASGGSAAGASGTTVTDGGVAPPGIGVDGGDGAAGALISTGGPGGVQDTSPALYKGGSSVLGTGGVAATSTPPTGYGSGGGGGPAGSAQNGTGGIIIIEEYTP